MVLNYVDMEVVEQKNRIRGNTEWQSYTQTSHKDHLESTKIDLTSKDGEEPANVFDFYYNLELLGLKIEGKLNNEEMYIYESISDQFGDLVSV